MRVLIRSFLHAEHRHYRIMLIVQAEDFFAHPKVAPGPTMQPEATVLLLPICTLSSTKLSCLAFGCACTPSRAASSRFTTSLRHTSQSCAALHGQRELASSRGECDLQCKHSSPGNAPEPLRQLFRGWQGRPVRILKNRLILSTAGQAKGITTSLGIRSAKLYTRPEKQHVLMRPSLTVMHVRQPGYLNRYPAVGMYCYLFTSENDCRLTVRAQYCSGAATNAAQ